MKDDNKNILEEIAFTDWWFERHQEHPTFADAIEWAENRQRKKDAEIVTNKLCEQCAIIRLDGTNDDFRNHCSHKGNCTKNKSIVEPILNQ